MSDLDPVCVCVLCVTVHNSQADSIFNVMDVIEVLNAIEIMTHISHLKFECRIEIACLSPEKQFLSFEFGSLEGNQIFLIEKTQFEIDLNEDHVNRNSNR